ncbi:MAG: hypothetical protein ACYTFT_08380, partial [Planctomycetota bacterium]
MRRSPVSHVCLTFVVYGLGLASLSGLLGGCGVGYPLAAILATSDDGGSDAVSTSAASIDPVPRQVDSVRVDYQLFDEVEPALEVAFEFALPFQPFQPATELVGAPSEGTAALDAAPRADGGVPHVFVWDAKADLGDGAFEGVVFRTFEGVVLRILPGASATGQLSAPFIVGNDPPVLVAEPAQLLQRGLVPLSYLLTDSTADPVEVDVEVVGVGPATIAFGSTTGLQARRAAEGGLPVSLGWSSLEDVTGNELVTLRATPRDAFEVGVSVDLDVLLDNSDAPTVFLEPIARQVGDIVIDLSVFDLNAEAVDIDTTFVATNGAETIGPLPLTLSTGSLVGVASDVAGVPLSIAWNSRSDLTFVNPGPVTEATLTFTPTDASGEVGEPASATILIGAAAPALALDPVGGVVSGLVPLRVTLTGPGNPGDLSTVTGTFTTDTDSTPRSMSFTPPSQILRTDADSETHVLLWNALADVEAESATVTVQLVGTNSEVTPALVSAPATQTFTVSNRDEVVASIDLPFAGDCFDARGGKNVPIVFRVFDAQSDPVSARVEIDLGDVRGFHVIPGGELAGLPSAPGGALITLDYDPAADDVVPTGGDVDNATLRVTVADQATGEGPRATAGPFKIDLNEPPSVFAARVNGRSVTGGVFVAGTVPIDLAVTDAEGDPAEIEVEVSEDGGATFDAAPLQVVEKTSAEPFATVTFLFDTSPFGPDGPQDIILRFTPRDQLDRDRSLGLGPVSLLRVTVDNDAVPFVFPEPVTGVSSGTVQVPFDAAFVLGDPVEVSVEFAADGDPLSLAPATGTFVDGNGDAITQPLPTDLGGDLVLYGFVWDSVADVANLELGSVLLRFEVSIAGSAVQGDSQDIQLAIDNGLEASAVIGRPDAFQAVPDRRGLQRPTDATAGGGQSWVVDAGNHRVLQFDNLPLSDFDEADLVLGRPGLSVANPVAADDLSVIVDPRGVAFDDATGRLLVTEGTGRILVWAAVPSGSFEAAAIAIEVAPASGRAPDLHGIAAEGGFAYVVDRANHRVLRYDVEAALTAPVGSVVAGVPDLVLGQADAVGNSAGSALDQLDGPRDVSVVDTATRFRLAVADTGNDRVAVWTAQPVQAARSATYTVDAAAAQVAGLTPVGVHLSVDGGLFVSNLADGAVLRFFDVPVAAPTAVDFVLAGFDEPPGRNNTGAAGPLGVGGDARGVLVADPGRNRILVHAEDDGAGGTLLPQTFQPAFAVIG